MGEGLSSNKTEQYQMNGALLGLLAGLVVGFVIFGGLGRARAGGVGGLFSGAILGAVVGKLNRTAGKILVGGVVIIILVALGRNLFQGRATSTSEAEPHYDAQYYEGEKTK